MAQVVGGTDIVVDMGAHVGLATIEFAHRARHVHAYEPDPENFAELKRNTRAYRNVTVYQKAVSDTTGMTRLFFNETKPGKFPEGSTIVAGKSNIAYDRHFDVETISAADLLDSVGTDIALIKMDIEGAEYLVLQSLIDSGRIHRVGKIYVECHVDRIPALAAQKAKVIAAAEAAGVLDKLDFGWP